MSQYFDLSIRRIEIKKPKRDLKPVIKLQDEVNKTLLHDEYYYPTDERTIQECLDGDYILLGVYNKDKLIAASFAFEGGLFFSSHCSPILGIKICFLNGRKELPNRSFLVYFLHTATVGGRGVCVAQTCTDARLAHKTAHIGTTRLTAGACQLSAAAAVQRGRCPVA